LVPRSKANGKFGDFYQKKKNFPSLLAIEKLQNHFIFEFLISLFGEISPVFFKKRPLRNLYKKTLVLTYLASVSQSQRDFTSLAAPAFARSS
jgi:hypothetical protein